MRAATHLCTANRLIVILAIVSTALTCGASECPVVLLDGATHADTFAVRLRVTGKLPVRRVQLGLSGRGGSASRVTCEEPNVLFYPGGS